MATLVVGDQCLCQRRAFEFRVPGKLQQLECVVPEGQSGIFFTGSAQLGVRDVTGSPEGLFVGPPQGAPEGGCDLRILEPGIPRGLEVSNSFVDLAEDQVNSAEGVAARPASNLAHRLCVPANLIDHAVNSQAFGAGVMARHHCAQAHELLDSVDTLEQALGDCVLPGGLPSMAQVKGGDCGACDQNCRQRCCRHRVPAGNLGKAIYQAPPAGSDRFACEKSAQVLGDLEGRVVASVPVDFEALQNNGFEVSPNRGIQVRRWGRSG